MNDVLISLDRPEDLAEWALYVLDVQLGATVEAVPHVLDQVLVAADLGIRPVLALEVGRNKLSRILEELIYPLDDVPVALHLDLEALQVDVRGKLDEPALELIDDVVHEHDHLVVVVLNAVEVRAVVLKLGHVFIELSADVVDSAFLEDHRFVDYLLLPLLVVLEELHECVDMLGKLCSELLLVGLGLTADELCCLLDLRFPEFNQLTAALHLFFYLLDDLRVDLVVFLSDVLLADALATQVQERDLVVSHNELLGMFVAPVVVGKEWRHHLLDGPLR